MSKIQVMDEVLANKIAAGEVVEKCMNVVKELVENSIDAKATTISIKLIDSGVKEIEVSDNGIGMDEDDAKMAFQRHATSKLKNLDDLFYIEAGTVHAIGAGALIAEVQENSNITYRLYDYDRVDKNGSKRPLHLDKALQVANLQNSLTPRQPLRVLKYKNGTASEFLTRCKYFQVERMLLNTEVQRDLVVFRTGSNSFHVMLCVNGCGSISAEGFMMNFFKGDCIFIPADSIQLKFHGKAQFLDISC